MIDLQGGKSTFILLGNFEKGVAYATMQSNPSGSPAVNYQNE